MKNVYKFLSVAFIASSFVSVQATNYYASPTGSGNGTSYNTPTTLKNGISKLSSAGDTLFVLGGQYDLNDKLTVAKSGNSPKHIFITNYPGEIGRAQCRERV